MIYLDNSATTVPDQQVLKSYQQVSEKFFANPSSIHELGGKVEQLQSKAREQIADLLRIEPQEVIFTSGGTEGNNLAIKGIALQFKERGNHIITTEVEHASVYNTVKGLEELGFKVTYLPVNDEGVVNRTDVEQAMTDDTILISVMHVNNEIGSIQPIEAIGQLVKKYPKVFFHVDAVQSLGKVPLQLTNSGIDLCTFSGHKIHGLKGTGMLYVKKGVKLFPLFHGGQQEFGIRPGTENVAGNVSFAKALRLLMEKEQSDLSNLIRLHGFLYEGLREIKGVYVNSPSNGAPHIVNVSVPGLKPETVIHALYEEDIIVSTQSACSSKQFENSRVLTACGLSSERASSGIRVSVSYETKREDIRLFLSTFARTIHQLKQIME